MVFNWLLIAIVFGIIEAMTLSVVTVWFAVGAVVAAIVAAFTKSFLTQFFVFVVISLLLLLAFIKKARRCLAVDHTPTNADRIIGQKAKVLEDVDFITGRGRIIVMGQIWSCKSEKGENIEPNAIVEVLGIEGSRAVVKKISK